MRTSILKKNFKQTSVLFYAITAFILSAFVLTSCSETTTSEELLFENIDLITQIESASKITVAAASLPATTKSALEVDFADSAVEGVLLAENLGYKVTLNTFNESRKEVDSNVFFSVEGKLLEDKNKARKQRRNKCFQFVFPVDFIMPDNSSITLNEKADWGLIKEWYAANKGVKKRPELVFPLNVTLEDGSEQTLIDREELKTIKNSCKVGKDKRKCFRLVLPVTFTMADGTEITVNEKKDYRLIRRWHKANPRIKEKGAINFPVDIKFKDETTTTITSAEELKIAKENCKG